MAEQHRCRCHGRPAIASRVRLRPDATPEIEYLSEIDPAGGTPEQFRDLIRSEYAKWGDIVRRSGAKID